jgi:hypothetical protein
MRSLLRNKNTVEEVRKGQCNYEHRVSRHDGVAKSTLELAI